SRNASKIIANSMARMGSEKWRMVICRGNAEKGQVARANMMGLPATSSHPTRCDTDRIGDDIGTVDCVDLITSMLQGPRPPNFVRYSIKHEPVDVRLTVPSP